jgi:iron complex outermembrane receptor protein
MKKIILYIFFAASVMTVHGQHTISGTISDQTDKSKLIEGVSVFIPEFEKFDISGKGGTYTISGIGDGIINIQFTGIGYKTLVKTLDTKENTTVLNIEMEPSSIELEEVVVTSNQTKLPDNIPYDVNVVSKNDIQKTGAPSLMDGLSQQPGVDKISLGTGINKPVIRGLSFNRILLYSQGTRVENQQWDDHHDLGISDVGLDDVEIIYGPSALIYGADALGGALIFRDEKPAASGTMSGDANLGFFSNTLGVNADAGIKGAGKSLFYSARFGAQSHVSYHQGELENPSPGTDPDGFAPNSKWASTTGKATVGLSQSWGVSKFSYSYFNRLAGVVEDEGGAVNPNDEEEQMDREFEAPYQDVTTHIASLENTILTGKSKLNINVAYQLNDRKEFEPIVDPGDSTKKLPDLAIGLMLNNTTYDVKWSSNADKKFGVTIGSQGLFQKNENNGPEILVPHATVSDVSGYALLGYDIPQWNFLGGFRFDTRHIEANAPQDEDTVNGRRIAFHTTKDYTPMTGSVGIAFHPNTHTTLKANFATGFSAPNYAELGTYGKHEGTYRFEIGNPDLKVQENMETDFGVIWENEFVTLHGNWFYNKINGYIYTSPTTDSVTTDDFTLLRYVVAQNNATITGGDAGFDFHAKSAKWIDVKATYAMIRGTLDRGGNLPFIPADKIIGEVKLSKDKMGKFSNTYFSIVVSNYAEQTNLSSIEREDQEAAEALRDISFDGYTLIDVHVGAAFILGKQKASFDIFCTNVANTAYFSQLSLVKFIGVRDMGRNIGFTLHVPFGFNSKSK